MESLDLSIKQVSEMSGLSTKTIHRRIKDGSLVATKPNGCREWRINAYNYRSFMSGKGSPRDARNIANK